MYADKKQVEYVMQKVMQVERLHSTLMDQIAQTEGTINNSELLIFISTVLCISSLER